MGKDNPKSHGKGVREGGTPDKHGQDQSNGIHTGVHLRETGGSVIQEESNCRRRHFWVAEENQGKWSRVWGDN